MQEDGLKNKHIHLSQIECRHKLFGTAFAIMNRSCALY